MKFGHSPLPPKEWDFRRLTPAELLPCALYEYARELLRASPKLQRALKRYSRDTKSLEAYGAVADILDTPLGVPYWRVDMGTLAWSDLPDRVRKSAVDRLRPFTDGGYIKPGDEIPGLVIRTALNPSKRGGRGITLSPTVSAEDAMDAPRHFQDFVASKTAASVVMGLPTDSLEFGFFAIDWNETNEHLRDAILGWLDREIAKRGKRKPAYSKRGKEKESTPEGWLRALGAMRLLRSGMKLEEARDYTAKISPALFQDLADWSKARRKTFPSVMQKLFGERAVWEEKP